MASQAILAALRGRYMHDPASELPRILLLGTRVNKGKKGRVRPHSNATVAEELHGR
jgi:hypothetical protein